MLRTALTALVAVAFIASAALAFETEDGVIIGTDANLDQVLAENEHALVEFYAPWCGHCKALAPEYVKAAETIDAENINAVLVKVDATVEEKSAERFQVQGYPTLKFFKNGEASDYNGGRTAPDIVNFLRKKTGPPAVEINTAEEADAFLSGNEVAYIGFFKKPNSPKASDFKAVASDSDYSFAITSNADLASKYGVQFPAVICLRDFDEPQVNYDGDFSVEDLASFVNKEAIPIIIEFGNENSQKLFGSGINTHLIFAGTKAALDDFTDVLTEVGKAFRGEVLMVFVNADVESNSRILEFFEITEEVMPAVRLIDIDDHLKKFALRGDFTVDSITTFINDWKAGNLKPFLKTEALPEDWDAKSVKVLTGENFDEVAVKSDKIVFVEFYAPWCGHCKQLAPIWDQLGDAFEGNDNVVIAKIDSTANEIEDYPVEGFPTLKLFSAAGHVTEYEGARELSDLVNFVNEHAGTNVEAPTGSVSDDYDDYYDEDDDSAAAQKKDGHDEL